ncbi:MAG TPA: RsmD family RNA methyltransferase, partial [Bacteroidia bacterium]|nr:RsmD family RNA methyltransferase [Bacteroidia bacterium]
MTRIIGGKLKGRTINAPPGLPVRPTTDFAKEGLFNLLTHRIEFESTKALDLFAGTG